MARPAESHQHRMPWRRSVRVTVIPAVLLAVGLAWLSYRILTVRHSLLAAQGSVATLRSAIEEGKPPAAQRLLLQRVTRQVNRAHAAAHDPVWLTASTIPVVGQPLGTVRGLADAAYRLAHQALPPLIDVTSDLNAARAGPTKGTIPLAPLQRAAGPLQRASSSVAAERQRVTRLEGSWLTPAAAARGSLLRSLQKLDRQVTTLSTAIRLAPDMLGAQGTRRYFVAFENPAEARGDGGLIGGYALLEATNGKVSVSRLGTDTDLPELPKPPRGLDPEWLANYGQYDVATEWRNTNASPHFPFTGAAWAAMYRQLTGVQVDGVLSLDPVTLSVLLKGAGPVTLPGIATVASANVVDFIERDEYALPLSTTQRKSILTSLGKAAVDRLLKGSTRGTELLTGLADAAHNGHLQLMSLRANEQSALTPYPLAGVLPDVATPFAQAVVNNAGGNKLDYYLRSGLSYHVDACDSTARKVTLNLRMLNTAPTAPLPPYASGRIDNPPYPVVPNQNRALVSLFLTRGARFVSATIDGRAISLEPGPEGSFGDAVSFDSGIERGHPLLSTYVELKPQQERRLLVTLLEPPSMKAPLMPIQPLPKRPTAAWTTANACPI